ncbi:MAG: hypothetical protein N2662_07750 [Bacteroidales bacterium]|nr:hypothetical protein [Bacteroidales bacterium]
MKKIKFKNSYNSYIFYVLLLLNVILPFATNFYPSMDGPAHLYNANNLLHLLKGNNFLAEFYTIHNFVTPNWTTHFILLLFLTVFPAWLAEKILIIIYIVGMAFSFRYLIKTINPQNAALSILIFPFIHSFLFYLGFYNFCFSFILYFFSIGLWLRNQSKPKNGLFYVVMFILFVFTYYSNIIIYGFLGITIGLFIIFYSLNEYLKNKELLKTFQSFSKEILRLLIISLPTLILAFAFLKSNQFSPSNAGYTAKELIKWINDARPFIVFDYIGEEIFTEQYFHILLILLVLSFIFKNIEEGFNQTNLPFVFAIIFFLSVCLYFIIPDSSNAGMMSYRFSLILYMFGLTWIIARAINAQINFKIINTIILITIAIHLVTLQQLNRSLTKLDLNASAIKQTDKYIESNSIVLPINLSDHWLEIHFSNYLGVEKPLIILENYEANLNWFPINWNNKKLPNVLLANQNSILNIQWPNNTSSPIKKQIDYVMLYGNTEKIYDTKWKELKELLDTNYKLKYKTNNGYVMLYEKMQ